MMIRSQNKEQMVFTENIKNIWKRSNYDPSNGFNRKYKSTDILADEIFIAQYSTEEKAIKVLDKIAFSYAFYQTISANEGYGGQVTLEPFVFQMPADNEVTI